MRVSVHKCRSTYHPVPIVGWLIMIAQGMNPFSKKAYDHMSISYSDRMYDVTGNTGTDDWAYDYFLSKYKLIESHEFNLDVTDIAFSEFWLEFSGTPYDRLQIFGLFFKSIGFKKFNTIGNNTSRLICNELVIVYLKRFHGFIYEDSDNFDLIDTWKIAKEY